MRNFTPAHFCAPIVTEHGVSWELRNLGRSTSAVPGRLGLHIRAYRPPRASRRRACPPPRPAQHPGPRPGRRAGPGPAGGNEERRAPPGGVRKTSASAAGSRAAVGSSSTRSGASARMAACAIATLCHCPPDRAAPPRDPTPGGRGRATWTGPQAARPPPPLRRRYAGPARSAASSPPEAPEDHVVPERQRVAHVVLEHGRSVRARAGLPGRSPRDRPRRPSPGPPAVGRARAGGAPASSCRPRWEPRRNRHPSGHACPYRPPALSRAGRSDARHCLAAAARPACAHRPFAGPPQARPAERQTWAQCGSSASRVPAHDGSSSATLPSAPSTKGLDEQAWLAERFDESRAPRAGRTLANRRSCSTVVLPLPNLLLVTCCEFQGSFGMTPRNGRM